MKTQKDSFLVLLQRASAWRNRMLLCEPCQALCSRRREAPLFGTLPDVSLDVMIGSNQLIKYKEGVVRASDLQSVGQKHR